MSKEITVTKEKVRKFAEAHLQIATSIKEAFPEAFKKDEIQIKLGSILQHKNGEKAIVACIDDYRRFNLIDLEGGNRWFTPFDSIEKLADFINNQRERDWKLVRY